MDPAAPIQVLHLCAANLYGGVERIVAECAIDRALCPGMQPAFAVCFEGRLAQEIETAGLPCTILGPSRVSRPHTIVRARRQLARLLESDRPDVVVCHSSWIYGLAAPPVRATTATLALWVHDRLSGRPWAERWARLTPPDQVITNSRFTDESVSPVYPGISRAVVYAPVPPGVADGLSRTRLRESLGVDRDTPVVLIASRFERWKGHRDLIEAAARIAEPWQMWIAGSPQREPEEAYEVELRNLAASSGVADRVRFLGERRDVPALMRAADVLCQPNTAPEPFGLVFVEALYAGLPVITTAMGGPLEIVTGECGALVPPGDCDALVQALRQLIVDPSVRGRLGAGGPARAHQLCDPARQLTALAETLAAARAKPVSG
ncbi:MAG: glycosyltransferase family 4 protein [Acidobacteriota bacterium]